ncbi:uncharacterized protein LOC131849411 [Achroia grisella]|uniref:uncharacterized protein LOC131849411 n=1 Tax=Achroia grisella TaxID=688607 RepID=UPI0027D307B1|nr:uncharacterized protein LOC131849411 [Achroia grisella]
MHLNDIKCNFSKIDSSASHDLDDIRADLTRFWQLEEICSKSNYFPEERMCEEHFVANTTRLDDGRFCVRIPLKHDSSVLGNSFHRAEHCLFSLERRLTSNLELRDMYSNFMTEYKSLGHMSEYKQPEVDKKEYFIPHHGVMRDSSTSTKLRVVFNASSPTTSGVSYNDIQMIGPTVQDDLISILLRFRQHKYVLSADVEKMYRQIIVHPSDRHLQQILWRSNVAEPITKFILNTVTYGTSSAPFLATRCLKQLGINCKDDKISEIIQHDFYVDDLLTGGNDLAEVQAIRKQVTNVLASACMPLRKWKSNNPLLMIDPQDVQASSFDLNIGSDEPNKLLGLSWHTDSDELCFPISSLVPNGNTKRDILSMIARIFDPLGLLAPCIINMKILLQQLWIKKLAWDEPLTDDINRHWNYIRKTLPLLNDLRVPRIVICDSCKSLELHVFSDASERAYGACIYLRSVSTSGEVMVRLLMAKSRVAPIKPTTIPRLELCGALMGARLYDKVITSLRLGIDQAYCWTDSTIVLGWLRMLPSRLQPFVRNRVAEVLERTENCTWRHVPTDENSADLISRGVDIKLQGLNLWWSGPQFLMNDLSKWPTQLKCVEVLPEIKPDISLNAIVINNNNSCESAACDGIDFHFIPAYAPHYGGLWEAGVKSTKYHLQRVLGNCTLTYEELNTTLIQIEAVLNSRPLTSLSSDPADYNPLTPGHFLIGRSLTSLPDRDYQRHSTNNLTRFQRIEQLRQHFWARWSKEYIAELQQRVKWRTCKDNLKLNTLVVIKEDNLPPLKWKLGRVVGVHPGLDGIVRVADIRTSTGVIRRAFSKICPLPVSSESH